MDDKHVYDYWVPPDYDNHVATKIARMVGRERRVLEIGAGPGAITRLLKEQGGCRVTAVEIDATALPKLAPLCERVFQRDLNLPGWSSGLEFAGGYDVVVAGDVLEHLYDPLQALHDLVPLLSPGGQVILSLPHAGHNAVVAALLHSDFRYHDWGLLDRTHIRFFGLRNVESLMAAAGLVITGYDYVLNPPEATELSRYWRDLPDRVRQALGESPYGNVYQVVVKARLRTGPDECGLSLAAPQPCRAGRAEVLKARVRDWLPAPLRRGLKKGYYRIRRTLLPGGSG